MEPKTVPKILEVRQTTCVIVGGGPAGVVLSYILARNGVDVTLLEMHHDFDRDFRGDTLHPAILEVMDELGLAERLLQLPHTKLSQTGGANARRLDRDREPWSSQDQIPLHRLYATGALSRIRHA